MRNLRCIIGQRNLKGFTGQFIVYVTSSFCWCYPIFPQASSENKELRIFELQGGLSCIIFYYFAIFLLHVLQL